MYKPSNLRVLIFFISICFFLTTHAQKSYPSGQFLMNETLGKTENAKNSKFEEMQNGMLKTQLHNQFLHYVFNDSLIARVTMDSLGTIKRRIVWNFKSLQRTTFKKEQGSLYHSISAIGAKQLTKNIVNDEDIGRYSSNKIQHKRSKQEKIEDWDVKTVPVYTSFGMKEYSISKEIELPYLKYVRPKAKNEIDSNVIIRKRTFYERGKIWLDKTLVDFSTEIKNPEWLDESVEGIPNISSYRYDPAKDKFSAQNLKKKQEPKFAKIPNCTNEVDIAVQLMNMGRFPSYDYDNFVNGGTIGRLSILVHTKEISKDDNPAIDKLNALFDLGLISKKEFDYLTNVFNENKDWSVQRRRLFSELYFLRNALLKPEFREIVLSNYLAGKYNFKFDGNEDKEFLEGRIDLATLLGASPYIYLTNYPSHIQAKQTVLFDEIKNILEPILKAQNIEYKIQFSTKSKLIITSMDKTYEIDFSNELKEGIASEEKRIWIDKHLVSKWLRPLTQLAADQRLEYAYGVNEWHSIFLSSLGYDYELFVSKYPELKITKSSSYILAMPKAFFWDDSGQINAEILQSEVKDLDSQIAFVSVFVGVPAGEDYITTAQKMAFLGHLKKYKREYKLGDTTLKNLDKEIKEGLYVDAYQLMNMIPSIHGTLPKFTKGFPEINPNKNDFKNVFPIINDFLNGDFKAQNLSINPLNSSILEMDVNGKRHGVELVKRNYTYSLLKFINSHLKESGKGIYRYGRLTSWASDYIYLTDEQKDELSQILKFGYRKVD